MAIALNKRKVKSTAKLKNAKHNEWMWGYILVAPTVIGLLILNIIPLIQTFILSFQKTGDFGSSQWAGFENYKRLFSDPAVWQATGNTLKYVLMVIPFIIIFSLLVAVLLNQKIKGKSIYRVIYFLPMVAAPAAVAMVWKWLFNSEFGLINYLLSLIGIQGPQWVSDPNFALIAIAIVGIWSAVGYNMILLLAGLQEIPKDYYEAASIDGAGSIRQFFSVTLPLVSPSLYFVMVTSIISAFQVFDVIFMMIDKTSMAIESTQSLVYLFYQHSFTVNDKGYGSAIIMLLLAIIMVITFIQSKIEKKWVHY
ncbi:MAG: carbohydrate ABC transporter permease [Turicibacter sanguinis]|jgi:ABC transporter, permease protein|nr:MULTISPECIES: sugar ABC transporter permease [Turicibacter]EGC91973.1 ABC transporter, permease protein [Turicibacter sp. HGF1]MCU7200918.1 sugar ABC transporter permease [Turicibacter sanguinis]MCU7211620.1 sugar ABC transporter permease [Turicibacter sanguinis]MDB8437810.1 sugar ABC transporter permease [Turicibacter sanguinis]MDB8458725.1 sugar ABC transporter permease [Turicibacter sanguinis]